jgi:gliding motility-associated peptidyl-prolyl isomerase
MRSLYFACLILVGAMGCQGPVPRRPVEVRTGSFIKESVERNKKLLALEEEKIRGIIARDTAHSYKTSSSGSWYYYINKIEVPSPQPEEKDLVTMNYVLLHLNNDTIYTKEEIGQLRYRVDQQELFPGLRQGIKLLKAGETVVFLFPSSLAYGYHGDNDKIGSNVPLKAVVSLLAIEKHKDSILN